MCVSLQESEGEGGRPVALPSASEPELERTAFLSEPDPEPQPAPEPEPLEEKVFTLVCFPSVRPNRVFPTNFRSANEWRIQNRE